MYGASVTICTAMYLPNKTLNTFHLEFLLLLNWYLGSQDFTFDFNLDVKCV